MLRPYQQDAINAIKKELASGTNRQLIQMATGTGKTVVFSNLPTELKETNPGQTLILAHREELVDQAINKMRAINPSLKVDKEKAEHKADPSTADVVVASVATLGRLNNPRLVKYNWPNFDKIVTDEAHHSIAQSYLNIYEASGILDGPKHRLLLGVTATPQRGDGKALAQLYQKISFVYSMRQAIESGWLVEVRGVRVNTSTSLDSIKTVGGDYEQGALAETVNTPQRNQLVVKAWLDNGQGRQTVGFTVDIKHAQDLAEMFQKHGVKAEAIWGDDPERADKLERHKNRETTVLLNCGVLTEGYDDWQIGCVILARPTKSSVLFTQMVGRGTRLQPDTGNLKEALASSKIVKSDCIVIDVVDSSSRHSLVTLPTLMGMASKLDLKGKGLVESVKMLEQAQKDFPHINFETLPDISQLKTYVESVNLFDIKFPAEVEQNSELSWYPNATGGYVIMLPDKDQLVIEQNMLDNWELSGRIRGKRYRGERDTVEEAFKAADDLIHNVAPEVLKLLHRQETWHEDPATPPQLKLLAKFYKGKPLPNDLTKGKASRLIASFMAGKA